MKNKKSKPRLLKLNLDSPPIIYEGEDYTEFFVTINYTSCVEVFLVKVKKPFSDARNSDAILEIMKLDKKLIDSSSSIEVTKNMSMCTVTLLHKYGKKED